MKKTIVLSALSLLFFLSVNLHAQGVFGTGITMAGNMSFVTLNDVNIFGSATQNTTNIGTFRIEQYAINLVGGGRLVSDPGFYLIDPPTIFSPLILRSNPVANTSYVSLSNLSSSSKSITVEQYYNTILIQSESFTLPGSASYYTYYLTKNAQKTFNSNSAVEGPSQQPSPTPEYNTYVLKVVVNN